MICFGEARLPTRGEAKIVPDTLPKVPFEFRTGRRRFEEARLPTRGEAKIVPDTLSKVPFEFRTGLRFPIWKLDDEGIYFHRF